MAGDVSVSGGKVNTPVGSAPVIPVVLIMIGGYLAWFGAHYWRQDVRWPSDPIKAVLQGKSLPASKPPPPLSEQLQADVQAAQLQVAPPTPAGQGSGVTPAGTAYQGTVSAGSAQNTAQLLLSKYGWDLSQMAALIRLWTQESGWSPTARNSSSGAFGIAQALGHGDAGSAAPDGTNEYGAQYGLTEAEAQAANAGNARWQIEWGLGYIRDRYGSPDSAWAHEQGFNWY